MLSDGMMQAKKKVFFTFLGDYSQVVLFHSVAEVLLSRFQSSQRTVLCSWLAVHCWSLCGDGGWGLLLHCLSNVNLCFLYKYLPSHLPPIPNPSKILTTTNLFSSSIILSLQEFHKWNHKYVIFWGSTFFTQCNNLKLHLTCVSINSSFICNAE